MYSTKWSVIARHIPGRTDDACSKRYREALDPSLKKDDWTLVEDDKLLEAYARVGGRWGQIGQELSRSGLGCRNRSVSSRICMSAIHLTPLHRWRLLGRKKLTAHSTRVPPNTLTSASSRHTSPPVGWSNLSMLEVTRFLDIDRSNPDDAGRSTLSLEHNPSYVRTQQEISGGQLPVVSTNSFWNDNDMSYAQSQPPLRLDISGTQARHTPPVQQHLPLDFSHDLNLSSGVFEPYSRVDTQTAAEIPEEQIEMYSPPETSNAHILDNTGTRMGLGTPTRLAENSAPYHTVSPATSLPSNNPFQSTGNVWDSQKHSNLLPVIHTSNAFEPPMSESTAPPRHFASVSSPTQNLLRSSRYYRSPLERSARKNSKDTQALPTLNSDLTATAESVSSSFLDLIQCSFTQLYSPSVKAYACGHQLCWPARETKSCACFATSRELNEHSKITHADDILGGGKPFRCGLDGCAKSWKSINGLQYHLQMCVNALIYNRRVNLYPCFQCSSRDHFQRALSLLKEPVSATQNVDKSTNSTKRLHLCPKPGCNNQYKQLSGLRYHLSHVNNPIQIHGVP